MAPSEALVKLRNYCLGRGPSGIKNIANLFRRMDDDNSGCLSVNEFLEGLQRYGAPLTKAERESLAREFDTSRDGKIDFDEFLINLRPPMSLSRVELIEKAWKKIDSNGDGTVDITDLIGKYDVSKHPKFLSGEMTKEEILKQWLRTFDADGDAKVTPEEFLNYYAGISASIDDNLYFDLMIRSAWKI